MKERKNWLKMIAFSLSLILVIQMVPLSSIATQLNVLISEKESTKNEDLNSYAKIVEEVEQLREEKAKYFICEDGSYIAASYSEPIHYEENGEWKEINNELELSTNVKSRIGNAMYVPKSGAFDIQIPQSFSDGQKISTTNKGYSIKFGVSQSSNVSLTKSATVVDDVNELPSNVSNLKVMTSSNTVFSNNKIATYNNEEMAVKNQAGAIVYEDIFSNADLEYIVTSNTIKENIVVNKKQSNYTYSFDMDFGELIPIVNEDNSIKLVEPQDSNETIFYIEAPFMYDANNVESTDIEMSLIEKNGIYVMTIKANAEWINSPERTFPVVIDPTIYLSFNDVFVMDGTLNANTTRVGLELRVGRNLTNVTRTYIKPSLPSNIPTGSYVNSAYLTLKEDNFFRGIQGKDVNIFLYDCYDVNYWNPDSITWNNQPYSNSVNGHRTGHSHISSVYCASSKASYSFNIKNAVTRWLNGGVNNGLMLASAYENNQLQIDFHSSRALNSDNHPQMYISYTAPTVSISSWETDSQAKESSAFTITTGKNWTASSDVDWISLSTTSGSEYGTSKIIVTENTSLNNRTGTVTVKMGSTVIGRITVTQYGAEPYLTLDISNLNFDVGQTKKAINIESNTVWSFGDLPNWLVVTPSQGSGNATVEIESYINNSSVSRSCNISVTADTVTKTININQSGDNTSPSTPNLYEEDGLVYMSLHSVDFDETTDTVEHLEYKLGNGEWIDYEDEPLSVIRTYDTTIYARACDIAGNVSEEASLVLECDLGEYTSSYTDIVLGEGVLPIGFERTYSSEDGWFFTFEANVAECRNGYVFTDFYGNKNYYIINNEGKYVSAYGEELKVEEGTLRETDYSYVVPYGELECYFNENGKLAIVKDNYNTATYSWASNNIYITDEASNTNIVRLSGGKPVYISATRLDSETNQTLSKNVQYQWSNDNLTKFIDAANNNHSYGYTNGLLTTNEDETITYSSDGRVKKIAQPNGAFVKYTYNDTAASADNETPGNIGAVTISDNKGVTDVWYYTDGFVISNELYSYSDDAIYNPNNISNEITIDNFSQVAYIITFPIGEAGKHYEEYPLYAEDDDGNLTFYAYNNENNVAETLFVKAGTLTVTEEPTFEQAKTVAVEKSTYAYDINGNVTEKVYQKRVDETFINQEKTVYSYNDKKSLLTQTDYQWINNDWYHSHSETYTYNGYGNVTSHITTIYTNTKNADTSLVETTYDINSISYEYDTWCRLIKETTNAGEVDETVVETVYDVLGRTIAVNDDGKITVCTYDSKDNVLTITVDGETTTYSYTENGNLVSRTNPNGAVAGYTYDAYGNLSEHTFNGYAFTYNTLGSILTASSESDQLVNYTYSTTVEQDVLISNYGNGQSVVYTYNDEGEVTAIKLAEETKYGYEYFETTDENGEVTEEWTELTDYVNNLKKTIEGNKTTVKDLNRNFIYSVENVSADEDVENSFDGVITTIGSDVYTLIADENKDTFKFNGTVVFTREYTYINDDLTNVKTAGLTTSFDYNADKLISVLENTLNDVSKIYGYTYDDNGNITTETVTTKDANGNVVSTETIIYIYDDNEQLLSAETSTIKYEYTYDNSGNILTKKEYAVTVDENGKKAYTLIQANTDTYAYDETWKDKLISYNGQTITYDAVGNPTNYMGIALTWTMGRQLASFGDISYTYNEDGIRTSKTSNGVTTKFYLDGTNIIEQTDGTTTLYFLYDSVGEIIGFKYSGNNYIYIKNSTNDIVGIADTDGNIIANYAYDAWGKVISITGSNATIGEINPFRYRSYYYDSDIQMYYLQSRYFEPEIGRFINSDNVNYLGMTESEVSYNPFAYCNNNPIGGTDEDGLYNLSDLIKSFNDFFKKIKSISVKVEWILKLVRDSLTIEKDTRKYEDKSIISKYAVVVNFYNNNVKKTWTEIWKSKNCKDIIKAISSTILAQFAEQTSREFLLDLDCLYEEIYLHLQGYMWSIGEERFCPLRFSGYYTLAKMNGSIKSSKKEFIKSATKDANIYEADMFLNKHESAWYGFDYFNGIASCYKNTTKDPFYNPKTKKRSSSYLREAWLYEEL